MGKKVIQELALSMAKKHKMNQKSLEAFITNVFEVVNEGLEQDRQVKIKGLGTFKVTAVKARESVNVNTGERVLISGHDKVSFIPDATMKELINKPFAQFETVLLNDDVDFSSIDSEKQSEETDEETADVAESETVVENEQEAIQPGVASEENEVDDENSAESMVVPLTPTSELPVTEDTPDKESLAEATETEIVEMVQNVELEKEQSPAELFVERTENTEKTVSVSDVDASVTSDKVAAFTDNSAAETTRSGKSKTWIWCLMAILLSLICFGLGYLLGKSTGRTDEPLNSKQPLKAAVDTVKTDTLVADKSQPIAPTVQELNLREINSDSRVKYGAYEIVGIDTIITLRHGQTMASYSRATLGPDMVCYFQALNDTSTLEAGDRMKVPKIKLKKRK